MGGEAGERTDDFTRPYNVVPAWHLHAKVLRRVSFVFEGFGKKVKHTTVIGMAGAFGKINLTSSNFALRRQFSAKVTHPAPLSPKPCAMITVAVCFLTAGTMRADG